MATTSRKEELMDLLHIALAALAFLVLVGLGILFFTVPAFRQWVKTRGKQVFLGMLKEYVIDQARVLVENNYQKIAAKVVSGELSTKDDVKKELYALGDQLKSQVKKNFAKDLKVLGPQAEEIIGEYVRVAADTTSPFPGQETAAAFIEDGVSDGIVKNGIGEFLRKSE